MQSNARINLRRSNAYKESRRTAPQPAPIVKWVGGKTKLLDQLSRRCPKNFGRYYEPFFGGGALFFHLAPSRAVLSDRNDDLVNMYKCVAWNVEAVIRRLTHHRNRHNETYYYEMRDRWNERRNRMSDVGRAAAFIYLNKTCYNGLWRVNSKGSFNVPVGRYDSPRIFEPDLLRATSRSLQRSDLTSGHYADVVESAESGDFLYFDPPYHPISNTARFTSYTSSNFGEDDQRELADVARNLSDRGCKVLLSNSDTPFIRDIYRGFRIDRVHCARAINSKASARGKVAEVIIANF